jgi:hypothetical protein
MSMGSLLFGYALLFVGLSINGLRYICWFDGDLCRAVFFAFLKADIILDQKLEELSFVVF